MSIRQALLVDLYELTMVDVYRRTGMADRPATFSTFVRTLPEHRNFLVSAGLGDVLTWLEELRFEAADLDAIDQLGLFEPDFLDWLGRLRFTGSVRAVPEGTIVFPGEPILEVDAPIAEAQLAESFLLNQITLQTTLATKATRCRHAAAGRAVIDFALRRTQGLDAADKLVRAGAIVGLDGTSNVASAHRYGVPASGTMAHSFVQAHADELEAFRAFASAFGERTVLLVDTFDTARGVDLAIQVAQEMRERGIELRGIRIDSGDLGTLARDARTRLDDAGFEEIQIFVSGGLDEYRIAALVESDAASIDGFGVGTALGVSDDAPALDSAYKLVSFDGRPVRKTSEGKRTWPGAKQVWRASDWSGDVLGLADEPAPADHAPLLAEVFRAGERTGSGRWSLAESNEHFEQQWSAVPESLRSLRERVAHPVAISEGLSSLDRELDEKAQEGT